MGILYYAINHTKKQVIELGKAYGVEELVGVDKERYIDWRKGDF